MSHMPQALSWYLGRADGLVGTAKRLRDAGCDRVANEVERAAAYISVLSNAVASLQAERDEALDEVGRLQKINGLEYDARCDSEAMRDMRERERDR